MVSEEIYALMQKGICPVCKCKIKKHSEAKRRVCRNKFAVQYQVKAPQLIEQDEQGQEISRKDLPFDMVSLKEAQKNV